MPANVETMAYVGEKPWHGQGNSVPPTVSSAEMIKAANLDWKVEKRPARGYLPIKRKGKDDTYARYEIARVPREGKPDEQEITLGMVTERYEPLQNEEAFSFFDPIINQKTATFAAMTATSTCCSPIPIAAKGPSRSNLPRSGWFARTLYCGRWKTASRRSGCAIVVRCLTD